MTAQHAMASSVIAEYAKGIATAEIAIVTGASAIETIAIAGIVTTEIETAGTAMITTAIGSEIGTEIMAAAASEFASRMRTAIYSVGIGRD